MRTLVVAVISALVCVFVVALIAMPHIRPGSSQHADRTGAVTSTTPAANQSSTASPHGVTPAPARSAAQTPSPTTAATTAPTARPTAAPTAPPTVAPTVTPPPAPPPPATGSFPVAYFAPDFSGPATRQFAQQFIAQIGSYVEVTYPAGSSAPSSGAAGGAQAKLPIARSSISDATLTYQVRFPVGFQWVKGGKLPGLCGGQCWTGSTNGPGGWATRFMWRGGGAGEVLLSDATTTGYGSDLALGSWSFQADGQWHTVSQHIHLNTPGQSDGYIDVTYNGAHVAHVAGVTFRTDNATQIDSLIFSTFYGGHDSSWAPSADEHIDFAAFHLVS
jgi:hypothetical protein